MFKDIRPWEPSDILIKTDLIKHWKCRAVACPNLEATKIVKQDSLFWIGASLTWRKSASIELSDVKTFNTLDAHFHLCLRKESPRSDFFSVSNTKLKNLSFEVHLARTVWPNVYSIRFKIVGDGILVPKLFQENQVMSPVLWKNPNEVLNSRKMPMITFSNCWSIRKYIYNEVLRVKASLREELAPINEGNDNLWGENK